MEPNSPTPNQFGIPQRLLTNRDLDRLVAIKKSRRYALIKQGLFPQGFILFPGGRARRWTPQELVNYLEMRIESGTAGGAK